MLIDPTATQPERWEVEPADDRTMLALQYITALIAVAGAALLGFIR